jgi:diguanylate cyclase (GGDEF)-like protein
MGPAARPVPTRHERPAEGEAYELLGFQRVLLWLRLVGVVFMLSQIPSYRLVDPRIVLAAALLVAVTAVAQQVVLGEDLPVRVIRRWSRLFLAADVTAMYVMGTAFTPDASWLAFSFYPLVTLEATLIVGTAGGLAITLLSMLVYLAQVTLHISFGNPVSEREIVGSLTMIAMLGGFIALFGRLADRGRRDLRVMLDLTSALAHQQDESEIIERLDQRLHDAVGARVRSIAVRDPDGAFQVIRWHSPERRRIDRASIESSLGDMERVSSVLASGTALTYPAEANSATAEALGLPDWARSITLVPIFLEGQWVGVLPVLWATTRVPNRHELRLLYGLAGHVGLALAQGQLQQARVEAATDPLTRLLNRRAIGDELASFVARASRSGGRLAILFCDLDGFKGVNDRRGHDAGDEVLRDVAGAVRGALRQGDVVGRYGGDELLVVAADATPDDAVALAQRVRQAVRAAAGDAGVDMTIGVAAYPDDGATDSELMVAADQAMYRGKLRGPGNVVLAGESAEPEAVSG